MLRGVLAILTEFVFGCLYGAFMGFCIYLVLHAFQSRFDIFNSLPRVDFYTLATSCGLLWGTMRAWIAWDHQKLEDKLHQQRPDSEDDEPREDTSDDDHI